MPIFDDGIFFISPNIITTRGAVVLPYLPSFGFCDSPIKVGFTVIHHFMKIFGSVISSFIYLITFFLYLYVVTGWLFVGCLLVSWLVASGL
jgi:hypothetical protein